MFIPIWLLVIVFVALLFIPVVRRVLMVLGMILSGLLSVVGLYFLTQGDKQTAYLLFIPGSPFIIWLYGGAIVNEWKKARRRDS